MSLLYGQARPTICLDIFIVVSRLAGLTAADFLLRHHDITILDRSRLDFNKKENGISIMCNAYNLLQKAGVSSVTPT